ncbi:DNA repair protein complementing XP-C cells homolog [Armigeres subalbatus]|uniref:DNA repair protein complementing XP-C cells homolog n=1 Tax=Armigeres subalbatus TaxID=124917 RepID=UPI002ED6318B
MRLSNNIRSLCWLGLFVCEQSISKHNEQFDTKTKQNRIFVPEMSPGKINTLREKIFSKLSKNIPTNYIEQRSDVPLQVEKLEPKARPEDSANDADDSLDSDGCSSVGDHLVNLEDIDLNSQFFSQVFQSTDDGPEQSCGAPAMALHSKPEMDSVESESDDPDEKEAVNVMLTQLIDFERKQNEARKALQNYGSDFRGADSVEQMGKHADISDDVRPTAEQGASDEEWQHVDNLSEADRKDVEVLVSQKISKTGKVIDVEAQLKRLIQMEKREKQLQMHKTHLLCLLGHGFHLNRIINDFINQNSIDFFGILDHFNIESPEETEISYLTSICDIYRNISNIEGISQDILINYCTNQSLQFSVVLFLVVILRFLSIEARLVMHLNVVSKNYIETKKNIQPLSAIRKLKRKSDSIHPLPPERYKNVPLTTAEILKQKPEFASFPKIPQIDGAVDDCTNEKRKRLDQPPGSKPNLWKLKLTQPKRLKFNDQNRRRKSKRSHEITSKFFNQQVLKTSQKEVTEKDKFQTDEKLTHWVEVYLPAEKRWVALDIRSGSVDCLDDIVRRLAQPVGYVFGWSNDGSLQDVSGRYWWPNEMGSRRLRVSDKWLQELIRSFGRRRKLMQDLLDGQEIRRLKFRAPVPDKISDFKNHPSYCLKRDLLKFQAIYPPDAPPLGYFREEPIYARECVHTLHSREVWLRHAKIIRRYETPYKVVMSKLKREKTQLELFGHWQTDEYVPPEAVGGRVPRNAYGNIEIFKDCMLPKGTVHLKQINISKTCRRLNVDYAIAVVGFGIHAGGNHPVFEGIVICKEFEQKVLAEYEHDQQQQVRRQHEKREKRIYDNWRKLIRGMLIRNKLRNKYNFDDM